MDNADTLKTVLVGTQNTGWRQSKINNQPQRNIKQTKKMSNTGQIKRVIPRSCSS